MTEDLSPFKQGLPIHFTGHRRRYIFRGDSAGVGVATRFPQHFLMVRGLHAMRRQLSGTASKSKRLVVELISDTM